MTDIVSALWASYFQFQRGKKNTTEMAKFRYTIEETITKLYEDIVRGTYCHGPYTTFTVHENKKRDISVASLRDRLMHRFLYDALEPIYDRTFIDDAWSCRKNKGVHGAMKRAHHFLSCHYSGYFWRGDVQKFFDTVDHSVLLHILQYRIEDDVLYRLLREVIQSYTSCKENNMNNRIHHPIGIPIGNITSQIFSNIYLNEFDRFVKHTLRIHAYVRYGDDFVIFSHQKSCIEKWRIEMITFLSHHLHLILHKTNNVLLPCMQGLHFLGYQLFFEKKKLRLRTMKRIKRRLNTSNIPSYSGLIEQEENEKSCEIFTWYCYEKIRQIEEN